MSTTNEPSTLKRQRARAVLLEDPYESSYVLGKRANVSASMLSSLRQEMVAAGDIPPRFEPGTGLPKPKFDRIATGYPGFRSRVVEATGLFLSVYENKVEMDRLIARLTATPGGVNGLLGRANVIRDRFATTVTQAVAAAMVETYNKGTPAKAKLNGWWSTFNGEA